MKKQWIVWGLALAATPLAHAFNPVIDLDAPSGPVYVSGFPADVTVQMQLSLENSNNGNCITDAIQDLTVTAEPSSGGGATQIHFNAHPGLGQNCPAAYSFDWSVPDAGAYVLVVTARHGNDDGTTSATFEYVMQMVDIEYPAPPAVANAYINETPALKKLNAKRRGCIISEVAKLHGKQESFGAKPGPYDEALIRSTVDSLLGC